jgi:hypothetical protein
MRASLAAKAHDIPSSAFRKFERNVLVDVDRIMETHGKLPAAWTDCAGGACPSGSGGRLSPAFHSLIYAAASPGRAHRKRGIHRFCRRPDAEG